MAGTDSDPLCVHLLRTTKNLALKSRSAAPRRDVSSAVRLYSSVVRGDSCAGMCPGVFVKHPAVLQVGRDAGGAEA